MIYISIFLLTICLISIFFSDNKKLDHFRKYNESILANDGIELALKNYYFEKYYYYLGKFQNDKEYIIIIGDNREWVNLIYFADQEYTTIGYNILEKRLNYGSSLKEINELTDIVNTNIEEINLAMNYSKSISFWFHIKNRLNSIKNHILEKNSKRKLSTYQKKFKALLKDQNHIIEFELSKNKTNYEKALKDCKDNYHKTNLNKMTCNCNDFLKYHNVFEINDIRRLCPHLLYIMLDRKMIKKQKNKLNQFIIENLKSGLLGLKKSITQNGKEFCLVFYHWSNDIFVITPKTLKEGFVLVKWSNISRNLIPNSGGKKVNDEIKQYIELYLK